MFSKAVVWGCPLHQHTNSYVYAGFHKAFKAMGFDAYWLNESSDVSGMDFSNSIFVTEWQHAKNMPRRKDCKYVLHNCNPYDYEGLSILHLQTYTDPCIDGTCVHGGHVARPQKINDHGSWYLSDPREPTIFQPWATDLLPGEINLEDAGAPRSDEVHWVGTIGGGLYGNEIEMSGWIRALGENGISWHPHGPGSCSFEENRDLVRKSYLAPSIHGTEQVRVNLPACRVFKNVSYGQLGGTNCRMARDLFGDLMVYNADTYQLFYDMRAQMGNIEMIRASMALVRDKHTYVSRIESILSVL